MEVCIVTGNVFRKKSDTCKIAAMTCSGRGENVCVGHDEEVGWERS